MAIFTHGLCETEAGWWLGAERHYGDPRVWHGSRLEGDLGFTPVTVRLNSGLHISDNGRRLATLIDQVVDAWPVPVEELLLVGHSMGGLINRSACHYGMKSDQRWIGRVRNVVTLGTPHLGAPLEQAAARLGVALNWTPGVAAAGRGAGPAQRGHQGPALRGDRGRGLAGTRSRRLGPRPVRATSRCWTPPPTT